ncbi:hypothetical protein V8E53_000504, partial [Lactarius tabidus]
VPVRPQVFFGRDRELKTIIDLISSSSFAAHIAIIGPGGVGKTALALAVLTHEEAVSRFGNSRYLVPCESLMSRGALLVAIANSLSPFQHGSTIDSSSVVGLESHVLSALRSEECILCLDNFESPWDQLSPSRRAVEMLLADITALPSVTVLITMRGRERPKETAWTLPMLPPLTNFPRDAAKRTWESLAGTCDEWAEKLIDAVECLPLAVTLLGSIAEVSAAETLWDRWQRGCVVLVENKGDKLASLEFSIAISLESGWVAADISSKRLLGILSMLPDGMPAIPLPEFQRLFPDIPQISQSLDTLLKCSLAVRTADKRVKANSLVRLYCESHDLASPEDRRTLRDYYVTLALHFRNYNNLNHCGMTMEMNNMESVLCKSLSWTPLPEVTPVIEAIIAYTQFCTHIGNFSDVVVTCAPEVQDLLNKTLGDFLTSLGSVSLCEGNVALAEVHFKRALVLHESVQDIIGQANDYYQLGHVLYKCHRMEEAMTCYRRALGFNVQSNNSGGQVNALTGLAETYKKLGRLDESREHYERSLTFHEEHRNQLSLANTLNDLGHVYLMMDSIKRAKESFKRALELHKAVNDPVGQSNDVSGLADVYQRLYKLARAEAAHKKTESCDVCTGGRPLSRILGGGHVQRHQSRRSREALWRSMPAPRAVRRGDVQGLPDETIGDCLMSLGSIYLSDGKVVLAEMYFRRALALHESAQDIIGQANDQCHLGDVLYRCDKTEEARTCYQSAFDLNVQSNSSYGQANALTHLGDTYRKLGRLEESHEHYQRSLTFHEEHQNQLGQANSLKGLGHVYLRMDDIKLAKVSFEKALELHIAVNDLVGQANDVSSLAEVYQRLDNLAEAEAAYRQSLDLHKQAKDNLGMGNALSHLGDLYRKQNRLSEAESYYKKALQSHTKASDKLGQANDLKGLGGIYHRQENPKGATEQYEAALELYEDTGNCLGKANCQRFLGRIFYSQDELDSALTMFQHALENYKKANDTIGQGNSLNSMGDVERRLGGLSKAEGLYKQALQAHEKANDKVGQGNDYKGLGIVYEKLYKLKDAKEMFEKAMEMHRVSGTTKSEEQDQAHLKKVIKKLEHGARTRKFK